MGASDSDADRCPFHAGLQEPYGDEGAFDPRVVHALIALIDRGEIKPDWGLTATRAA